MCIRDLLQEGIEEEEVWESEGACKVREEEQDHSLSEESILEEWEEGLEEEMLDRWEINQLGVHVEEEH